MPSLLTGTDWSQAEVALCVDSYFEHLALELSGIKFNKAQLYRTLAEKTGRTPSSIEFKFQNISAVLNELGREWMKGLAPLANFQELLAEKVSEHIDTLDMLPIKMLEGPLPENAMQDFASFFLEAPPELLKSKQNLPEYIVKLARKFDPGERDARNRSLGAAGEEFVLNHEKRFLSLIGRNDLAESVRWVSKEEGDGAGYDILSYTDRGDKKFVEVKTTVGGNRTPFFVSRNEYDFSKHKSENYSLVRLFDFRKGVRGFEMKGEIDRYVKLKTEIFRAEFYD
jgi:Domain of unknown function (DUF3883)